MSFNLSYRCLIPFRIWKGLLILAFLFFGTSAYAHRLSGIVKDGVSNKEIPNARLIIERKNVSVYTDERGRFVIEGLPAGEYSLVIFQYGYQKEEKKIDLKEDLFLQINLFPLEEELDQVEVKAELESDFTISRLNPVEGVAIYAGKKNEVVLLDKIDANMATNSSRQLYAKVAGLNIWESDAAGLQLGIGGRGLSPNRTSNFNTRQNGYDISADALGYPESYYTPSAEAMERIEVIRGASSLQYGTQFGGVVNFVMKKGTRAKPLEVTARQTAGSFGLYNAYTSLGGTHRRWNYYTAYQFKRGNGWRENAGFTQHNFYSSVHFTLTEKIEFSADYTYMTYLAQQPGGLTDFLFEQDARQSIRERNWFGVDWNLFSLSANIRISNKTQINIRNFGLIADRKSAGFLGAITKVDPMTERDLIFGSFRNLGNETRFLHRYRLRKNIGVFLSGIRLYTGNTRNRQGLTDSGSDANFSFNNPDDLEGSDYSFPSKNVAVFAENIFYLSERFTITPGVRLDYIKTSSEGYYKQIVTDFAGNIILEQTNNTASSRERTVFLSGVGFSYKMKKAGELYANISQNYRAINFSDLQIVNPNYRVDPDIKDEYGYTTDLGWRGTIKRFFTYDVSVFYIDYRQRIGELLQSDPQSFQIYRYRTNIGDSYNMGVESFLELDVLRMINDSSKAGLSIFANTSLIEAEYLESENSAISGNKVELVPQITFRSGMTFRSNHFSATFQYSYTAEQFTDATNAEYSATAVSGIVPAYSVMDFSTSYSFKWVKLEAGVNNLLDERYFTRRASGYPGPGILSSDGRNFYITLQVRF